MPQVNDNKIIVKFAKENYISHIIKLVKLISPNKVIPVQSEFCDIEDKINKCTEEFVDTDECSTVGLSSNPSSFSSDISAEELFSFDESRFRILSVLGSGSFGKVFLAQRETKLCAIKKLPKNRISKDEMAQVLLEKQILTVMESPFVLRLYGTYQTKNELCFVSEVVENGDLFNAIYNGDRLTHQSCVFYGACIVLALDYIHRKNVVYRDLKPENIMIGSNGYPKIIDFGLSKQLPYSKTENGEVRTFTKCLTLCGTPEYVAPEMILRKKYDGSVDIWSLGVILYEMICRTTPFVDNKKGTDVIVRLFTNIVLAFKHGIDMSNKIDKRTDGTDKARALILQLLSGDTTRRLGPNNSPAILLQHPYFTSTSIKCSELYNQSFPAPIIQDKFITTDIENENYVEEYSGSDEIFADF